MGDDGVVDDGSDPTRRIDDRRSITTVVDALMIIDETCSEEPVVRVPLTNHIVGEGEIAACGAP